jgi:hypothetical protein
MVSQESAAKFVEDKYITAGTLKLPRKMLGGRAADRALQISDWGGEIR